VSSAKAARPAAEVSAHGPQEVDLLAGEIDFTAITKLAENQGVADEIALLRARWRPTWVHGAKRGFEGERQGSYPPGFARWPLDKRNAWWSGFNRGYHDRLRLSSEKEG
jgi:hypothetical protein